MAKKRTAMRTLGWLATGMAIGAIIAATRQPPSQLRQMMPSSQPEPSDLAREAMEQV